MLSVFVIHRFVMSPNPFSNHKANIPSSAQPSHNIYAIGDVQGCDQTLARLIKQVEEDHIASGDSRPLSLWFAGDMVNRGPRSLATLRRIYQLRNSHHIQTVLGNHDMHTLKVAAGVGKNYADDTITDILHSPERDELLNWLRHQALAHVDQSFLMVHAGVYPQWRLEDVLRLANEVQQALRAQDQQTYLDFMRELYGETPLAWSETLTGMNRIRCIVNAFTRVRYCKLDQSFDFSSKSHVAPEGSMPWFNHPQRQTQDKTLVFGHWSAMGLVMQRNVIGLDTGCVWGGYLTAVRLADRHVIQVKTIDG
jgi:bis(5'-nucleosyl)-tetraphosphatase (symmetrical)